MTVATDYRLDRCLELGHLAAGVGIRSAALPMLAAEVAKHLDGLTGDQEDVYWFELCRGLARYYGTDAAQQRMFSVAEAARRAALDA